MSEKNCKLRSKKEYDSKVSSKKLEEYGLNESCVFHDLTGFHCTSNFSVDPMHDLLEGVCRYDAAVILYYFIYVAKFFTLHQLNERIRGFNYGCRDNLNKPVEIKESDLKKKVPYIVMSAAEMLEFMKHCTLLMGDFVPQDSDHWELLLLLKKIVDLTSRKYVTVNTHKILGFTVEQYLAKLHDLFSDCFKPKHHFLLHYAKCMENVGPLWNIACMRFESKHSVLKRIARASISRVNVCKTMAVKHQVILMSKLYLNDYTDRDIVKRGSKAVELNHLENSGEIVNLLPFTKNTVVHLFKRVKYFENVLKRGTIIVEVLKDSKNFYSIHDIISKDEDIIILLKRFNDVSLEEHYDSYKIKNENDYSWKILNFDDVKHLSFSYTNRLKDGHLHIAKSWL